MRNTPQPRATAHLKTKGSTTMFIREIRHIDTSKVRAMCISHDYYTQGTIEEYNKMFQKCELGYGILAIASDILDHSNKDRFMKMYGCTEREVLESICYNLVNDCTWTEISLED